jgi:hypothetical protein
MKDDERRQKFIQITGEGKGHLGDIDVGEWIVLRHW